MATIYVDSAAGGSNDGTSWTNAYTSIASATGVAAGDTILVDDGHSQTFTVTTTLNFSNATLANPVKIVCVDKADDSLSSGAVVKSENTNRGLTLAGHLRCYGMTFRADHPLTLCSTESFQVFDNCTLGITATSGAGTRQIVIGSNNSIGRFLAINTTIDFTGGNTGSTIGLARDNSYWEFRNCSFALQASQSALFGYSTYPSGNVLVTGADLSAAPNALVTLDSRSGVEFTLRDCNIPSAWISSSPMAGTITNSMQSAKLDRCSNGTISLPPIGLTRYDDFTGTIKSTLAVYRTGGSADGLQSNAMAWEMVSTASAVEIHSPLKTPPITRWLAADASIVGATARGVFASTRCAPKATPTALTTDSGSTWNGSGVGTKQKIDHTLTNGQTLTVYVASGVTLNNDDFWIEVSDPDQVGGPVSVVCCLAKPSTTVYVDPRLEVA